MLFYRLKKFCQLFDQRNQFSLARTIQAVRAQRGVSTTQSKGSETDQWCRGEAAAVLNQLSPAWEMICRPGPLNEPLA